jgi:ATP-binding cassette subfamily F protein 3
MRLAHFDHVSLIFPGRTLFDDVTWSIFRGDRYGLVGPNGAGKTTMLRLLVGDNEPTIGTINRARDLTAGYLPQEGITHKGKTLFEETWSGLPDLPALQREIEHVHQQLTARTGDEDLIERAGALEHRWQDLEGYHAEAKVARVLAGLGFKENDFPRRVEEFSGGWQMRIALAKLLLHDPDLLLLDEPTNHLDLPALVWLEDFLKKFEGALVIVSHDRYFLDRVIKHTAELERGVFTIYPGNYSEYERRRDERQEQLVATAERQAEERKRVEAFIERFRYKATKARQVQSRIKALEKMQTTEVRTSSKKVRFHFPPAPPSGRIVLELHRVHKSYGATEVFRDVNLVLHRGEKVALVGVNGAGKSTLCRLIAGVDSPSLGDLKLGHKVEIDYFAQEADFHLNPDLTVLEQMEAQGGGETPERLRGLLGAFLFSGDDVFKPTSVLSGGEKSRLALAKMLLHPSNFVILDEPTNHLDMASQDVLLSALKSYDGTLLVVSHDRHFLDRLVDRVLEIDGGVLRDWPGNLSEYLARKDLLGDGDEQGKKIAATERIPVAATADASRPKSREQKRAEAEVRNRFSRHLQDAQTRASKLQIQIEQLENRKTNLEAQLAGEELYREPEKSKKLLAEYETIRRDLPGLVGEWEQAAQLAFEIERERDAEVRKLTDETA